MKTFIRMFAVLAVLMVLAVPAFAGHDGSPKDPGAVQEIGVMHFTHYAADGTIKGEWDSENTLANDGQQDFLDIYLRYGASPSSRPTTSFYLGLTDSTSTCSIAKADNLTTVVGYGEPSGYGYARILIEASNTGWPTLATDSGDYMATSKSVTFTASGGAIGPVYCAFLTNAASGTSGKHISWAALSTGRTLASGESLAVTYKIKLQ